MAQGVSELTSDALKIEPNSIGFTTVVGSIFNASDVNRYSEYNKNF
jgi:hypothetical protein